MACMAARGYPISRNKGKYHRAGLGGGIMPILNETLKKEFKVWMVVSLGLIKDGKLGASQSRSDRIKTALAYTAARELLAGRH